MVICGPLKLDFAKKTLCISVRDLVEFGAAGHRNFGRENWWIRLGLGVETHSKWMERRGIAIPGYQKEVWLEREIACEGWTVLLQGRADAVYPRDETWVIEEYKTAHVLPSRGAARHQLQLLLYAYLWEAKNEGAPLPQLVYCAVASEDERIIPVNYIRQEVEDNLLEAIREVLRAGEELERSRQEKLWAALSLPFPHRALRPGQDTLIKSVEESLRWKGTLLAQAPTGIGKTAATLYASVKAGLEQGKRVFFLTSKTLQQEIAVKTLKSLNSSGAFKTMQLASKEKMCANDRVICHEDACPYAKDFAVKMERAKPVEKISGKHSHFDPREVFTAAKKETVCPFEVQLELASRADVLVADYNYVFEPSAALSIFKEGEEVPYLIIDEAHNLADRVREIYSPVLILSSIDAAKGSLIAYPGKSRLIELLDKFAQVIERECKERASEISPPKDFTQLWPEWERGMLSYFSWKGEQETFSESDGLLDFHFAYVRWMLVMGNYNPGFTCVAERLAGDPQLGLRCLDPAGMAGKVFKQAAGSVLLSATLEPMPLTGRILGVKEPSTVEVPSPFPAENRKVLIYPEISTTYQNRPKCYKETANLLKQVAEAHKGRTLVLFPSYEFLRQTVQLMEGANILVQRSGAKQQEQTRLYSELAGLPNGMLCAVLGGMYAEGLDYPGNLLNGVVVVSPGLPQVNLERELIRKYYEEECGDGFLYAYLQPGMTKVIQAAGRLIRSEKDRGFILLICSRFMQPRYAELLPHSWHGGSPNSLLTMNPAADIQQFFSEADVAFAETAG